MFCFFWLANISPRGVAADGASDEEDSWEAPLQVNSNLKICCFRNSMILRYDQGAFQAEVLAAKKITCKSANYKFIVFIVRDWILLRCKWPVLTQARLWILLQSACVRGGSNPWQSSPTNWHDSWERDLRWASHDMPIPAVVESFSLWGLSDSRVVENLFHLLEKWETQSCCFVAVLIGIPE